MRLPFSKKPREVASSMTQAFIEAVSRPVRVLLVEDDAGIRMVLANMFSGFNVKLEEADSRESACELARVNNYDLALVDLRLPWPGNGIAVMRVLTDTAPDLPICAYSGYLTPGDINASVEAAGVITFVPKNLMSREYIVKLFRKFNLAERAGMKVA